MDVSEDLVENKRYPNNIDETDLELEIEDVAVWAINCARRLDGKPAENANKISNLLLDHLKNNYNKRGADFSKNISIDVSEAYEIANREKVRMAHSSYERWDTLYNVCSEIEEFMEYQGIEFEEENYDPIYSSND